MSESEIVESALVREVERKLSPSELAIASAREQLTRYLPRAVQIITELAETSENDRVRLAAAESIADRAGLGKSSTTQVTVSQGEHEALDRDLEDLVGALDRNRQGIAEGKLNVSLEGLIIHEGEVEAERLQEQAPGA